MPAHKDSEEGLALLNNAGFRMVTLTNSPPTPDQKSLLENVGLDRFFDKQYNIEACALLPIPGLPQPNATGTTLPELAKVMINDQAMAVN